MSRMDTDEVKQKKSLFSVNALGVMRDCFMFLFFCFIWYTK